MAGEDDPYAKYAATDATAAANPTGNRQHPLTFGERWAAEVLFDTQPKRREAYLAQHGLQLNPNDTNEYRPMGSQAAYQKIDPTKGTEKLLDSLPVLNMLGRLSEKSEAAYQAYKNGGFLNGLQEAAQQTLDAAPEAAVKGYTIAKTIAALTPQTAVGAGLLNAGGALLAKMAAGALGSATGNDVGEIAKHYVGNLFLNKDIPSDEKLLYAQDLLAGAYGAAAPVAGKLASSSIEGFLAARTNKLSQLAKQAGAITEPLRQAAVADPDAFQESFTSKAAPELAKTLKQMIGIPEDETSKEYSPQEVQKLLYKSSLGDKFKGLVDSQTQEETKLDANPQAAWKVSELTAPAEAKIKEIEALRPLQRTQQQAGALKELNAYVNNVQDDATQAYADSFKKAASENGLSESEINDITPAKLNVNDLTLPYTEGRQHLENMQAKVFGNAKQDIKPVVGSDILAQVIGGGEKQLRAIADQKAKAAGSSLPDINSQISDSIDLWNRVRKNVTQANIKNIFTGTENPAKSDAIMTLKQLDDVAGTNYSDTIQKTGLQLQMQNARNRMSQGSSAVNAAMAQAATDGLIKGGGVGALLSPVLGPLAPAAGAASAAALAVNKAAALSSPEAAISAITNAKNLTSDFQGSAQNTFLNSNPESGTAAALSSTIPNQPTAVPQDDDDPYAKYHAQ